MMKTMAEMKAEGWSMAEISAYQLGWAHGFGDRKDREYSDLLKEQPLGVLSMHRSPDDTWEMSLSTDSNWTDVT